MKFCHLNIKTEYSILNSICKIDNIKKYIEENNSFAIGIMDEMSLSGGLSFSDKIISNKKTKPIIGASITIYKREYDIIDKFKLPSIGLIAKNENGYKNLLKLLYTSYSYEKHNTGQNYVKIEDLLKYKDDLICLTGGQNGILKYEYRNISHYFLEKTIEQLMEIFTNNIYLELTRHGYEKEKEIEDYLIDLAYKKNIPLVATNDVHFLEKKNFEAFDTLCRIREKITIYDDCQNQVNEEHYLKSEDEMIELFSDIPEAILNTIQIAKRCNYIIKKNKPILPTFQIAGKTEEELLEENARNGLAKRFELIKSLGYDYDVDSYYKRLDYELSVINKMKFAGYFLIVADFIQWAKNKDIAVGPGRGSGAGSIIAWAIGITNIDPIKYGLIFERFLNPDRVSMPDFDIDFCQERRGEVIEYVKNKFGYDKVAHIVTYGKLQAKAVIKDVGRVLGMPYLKIDEISKLIPFNPIDPITLEKAVNMDPNFQQQIQFDAEVKKLVDISMELEGLNRHTSTHAAGIIIADRNIIDIAPLMKDEGLDIAVIAYDMKDAEKIGLMKFDFLGLKTLTVISSTINLIKDIHNQSIDIDRISLTDEKTFNLLKSGDLKGIFQFEASIPRITLKKINISQFEDLSVVTSLARPGPMEYIPTYIKRKTGEEKIDYYHDLLKNLLLETSGIIIYQEQVMEIARILAGYSLAEADLLRRAMGKKIQAEMDKQKDIFANKAKEYGLINEEFATEIFNILSKFVGYGFNKSHATSYSMISYQTAYLKAHYMVEFLTSVLNLDIDDTDKLNEFIIDAKKYNIQIVLPNINTSDYKFTCRDNKIYYGLSAIKGIGSTIASEIIEIRNQKVGKKFDSLDDFLLSCGHLMNKKTLDSLIRSSALIDFGFNMKTLILNTEYLVDKLTELRNKKDKDSEPKVFNLFGEVEDKITFSSLKLSPDDYSLQEKLQLEFEAIGFYLSQHPAEVYLKLLQKYNFQTKDEIEELDFAKEQNVFMFGVIVKTVQRYRKNKRFAFVHLLDTTGLYEGTIFNDELITNNRDLLDDGSVIAMTIAIKESPETGKRFNILYLENISKFVDNIEENMQNLKNKFKVNNYSKYNKNNKKNEKEKNENEIATNLTLEATSDKITKINISTMEELDNFIENYKQSNLSKKSVILKILEDELLVS